MQPVEYGVGLEEGGVMGSKEFIALFDKAEKLGEELQKCRDWAKRTGHRLYCGYTGDGLFPCTCGLNDVLKGGE